MTPREEIERQEAEWLSPRAVRAAESKGREVAETDDPLRTCFQRDRDRVIHSKAFRRLKHKTQVFLAPEGDHYRTRLTHTLEVAQVARTAARALRLNEDLTEAIVLAHDLGHPPFGHAGEDALDEVLRDLGGFKHYEQSLRVVELLEIRRRSDGSEVRGLNLTWEVRDGIGSHSKGLRNLEAATEDGEGLPSSLEGQIARLADRIAYVHHDTDDAARAGLITEDDVPADVRAVLGRTREAWIGVMVADLVAASRDRGVVALSDPVRGALNVLKDFLAERVYHGPAARNEVRKAQRMIKQLYAYFREHPDEVSPEYRALTARGESEARIVGDFLAGMTDRYAIRAAETLLIPRTWAF
ncbi:MAG TPA: deoxyguanosinetriphosphate triphosphohydrolase [bacterium]|jgi:dGTPase